MRQTFLILLLLGGITACGTGKNTGISSEDPKGFAKISVELADNKGDLAKNTKLYEKYGYNLTDGTIQFNKVMQEIEKDEEKYKIYDTELYRLMLLKANIKVINKNDEDNKEK